MWFKDKEISTALGISLCICRLGSSLNSYLSPYFLEQTHRSSIVSGIGVGWVALSFICGLVLIKMDEKYISKRNGGGNQELNVEQVKCSQIKKLNISFWLLYFNAILCFLSFFSWLNIANKYLQLRFEFSSTQAGGLLVIPYGFAALLTPLFSWLVDKNGKKASLMIVSCAVLSFVHYYLAYIPDCHQCNSSLLPLFLYGLFFAMYTALLISSVSVVANHKVIGTAFGIIYSG